MLLTDIQIVQEIWRELDTIVCVPRTESDYRRISALRENLITLIGENENHALTSLLEVIEALIEKYTLEQESVECETLYRLCIAMLAQAYVEDESENTVITSKCLNPDDKEQ